MAESRRPQRGHGPGPQGHGFQRPKDFKGTVQKLLRYIGRYKAALVLVFVLRLQLVQLNLTMAWVNTKINSTSASVHNSNIVNVYGEGLFLKRLSPISLYGIL